MIARPWLVRSSALAVVAGVLAFTTACSGSTEETRPTAQPDAEKSGQPKAKAPKPPPKPKGDVLRGSPAHLGPITWETAPTVEAIDAALGDAYTVREAADDAMDGVTVQVLRGDTVVLDVWPAVDGEHILRATSADPSVVFPWNSKAGDRLGDHKNWDRMTCSLMTAPFQGKAMCNAFPDAKIVYVVEGWEGDAGTLPGKELLADLKVSMVMWRPGPEEEKDKGKKGEGEEEAAEE